MREREAHTGTHTKRLDCLQYTNLKTGPPELTKIEPPADDKKKK